MSHPVLLEKPFELTVDEVLPSVTNHHARHTKAREDDVMEEALPVGVASKVEVEIVLAACELRVGACEISVRIQVT